jgi:hypothetical protein
MRITQRKGDIALATAITTFTRLDYDVLLPLTESAPYDLIIDDGSTLIRVQVKFCGGSAVDLRRIHSNAKGYVVKKTNQNEYDWLYVLTSDNLEYLFKECLAGRRSVTLVPSKLID